MGAFSDLLTSGQVDPLRESSTLGSQQQQQPVTPATPFSQAGLIKAGEEVDPERPGFELAFGFFPVINLGNIMGVENDVARIAANILLDPITLGTTFLTGGLTAAGKVASASRSLATSKLFLGASKGVRAKQRVEAAQKSLKGIMKIELAPKEAQQLLKTALEAKDIKTFTKTLQKVLKTTKLPEDVLKHLPTSKELYKLDKLAQAEKFFLKSGGQTNDLAKLLHAGAIEETVGAQVLKNAGTKLQQRDFLRLKVPFTGIQKTLINGEPMWSTFGSYFNLSPILTQGGMELAAKSGIEASDMRQFLFSLMDGRGALIEEASLAHSLAKVDQVKSFAIALGEGKDVASMSRLLTFFREGRGVPVSLLDELGLTKHFDKVRKGKDGFEFVTHAQLSKYLKQENVYGQFLDADKVLQKHFDTFRKSLNESGLIDDIPYIQSYISHLWDLTPDQAKKEAVTWAKKGFMQNKRSFNTFLAGMNKSYTLKFDNAWDIGEQYAIHADRTLATRNVIETLRANKDVVMINNKPMRIMETEKKLRAEGIIEQYTKITNPRVLKLLTKKGFGGAEPARIYVPKQMAKDLEIFFGEKWTNAAAKGLDNFNAVAKVMSLSFSMFHSMALTESAMATMGPVKGFIESAKLGFGLPFVRDNLLKVGAYKGAAAKLDDGVAFALRSGLQVARPSDAPFELYNQTMNTIGKTFDKVIPGSGIVPRTIDKAQAVMSRALWDNFHHPMKLVAFDNRLLQMQKKFPNSTREELAKDAAAFVNNAFGGGSLEQLMLSPKMRQIMHWALLAPDWTISNMRIAGVGTTGVSGTVRGVLGAGRNPAEQMVGAYWRNALPVFFASYAMLNKSLSGNWPWDNDPGHKLDVSMGTKDEKGRNEYFKMGKQFREPFRWLTEPEKIFGAKLSPGIQTVIEQLTKHSTTGFPVDFADKQGAVPMTFIESTPHRFKEVLDKFVPFSVGGKNVMFAFPKSTFKEKDAIIALKKAMQGPTGVGVKLPKVGGADRKYIADIFRLAQANNLNIGRIRSAVKRDIGDPRGLLGGKK